MLEKFKNKYRISSARLQNWDYGWNASYFVTICTQNREYYFGDIVNTTMQLTEIGEIAQKYWLEIPNHFPFVELGEFIVMPNHVHGIIVMNKTNDGRNNGKNDERNDERNNQIAGTPKSENIVGTPTENIVETPKLGVSTTNPKTTTNSKTTTNPTAPASEKWKPATLGVIINQYKRIVTINARKIHADFGWQSRFHDHIIRNEKSFQKIKNYILENPLKWTDDKFYQ